VRAVIGRSAWRCADARLQQGSAIVAFVLALLWMAALALSATPDADPATAPRAFDVLQRRELAAARDRILEWYATRLPQLDSVADFAPSESEVFEQAGIVARRGVRLAAGPLLADSLVRFRPLALWFPASTPDRSGFDHDGIFRADPSVTAWSTFSTRDLERRAYSESERVLRSLALDAERRFAIKVETDPDRRIDRNWFRAPDGRCRIHADQLPCANELAPGTWVPVALLNSHSLAFGAQRSGGDARELNAWGQPNYWSNDIDRAFDSGPPFSMAFSTLTPWGSRIVVRAVQPL
jgi:hypothetical protein